MTQRSMAKKSMTQRLIMAAALLLLLGACSQKAPGASDTPDATAAGQGASTSPGSTGNADAAAPAGKPVPGGYVFAYNGAEVALGGLAEDFIAAAGQPGQIFEAPSCAFEGIDKILYYPGFTVNTYPVEGTDYILAVVFADDSVTTAEGVYLGMTRAEIESVYGSPTASEANGASYAKDGMSLRFVYEDDVAVDITYYNDAALETAAP
jgi:hypothetical protein